MIVRGNSGRFGIVHSCVGDGDEWRLGDSSLWDGDAGPRTDSSSDDGSSTVATFTTCFLTVAGGFLVLDIVTFLRFFCRCCVGDGDGDLRSGEDFLRGGGVGSRIDSSSDVERMVPSSAFFITLFLTGQSFFVLGIFKMLQLVR